jgi:glycosyltransferase involved in cell wall biosynthesis
MAHTVCHLIDANLDTNYFRSIARHHDRERFPVLIGSIWPSGSLQEAMASLGTPTFSLEAHSRRQYPGAVRRLAALLRERQVSLLHAHCFDPTALGLVAARIARVPFVFTRHHSNHNIRLGKRWHTRIDAWCARHADHVIAVSEATRRIMIDVEKVPGHQITVVHNGVDPLSPPEPGAIDRLRGELANSGTPVVLMVARLHEEKGFHDLFEALPAVVERVGPLTVLIAGDGPHRAMLEEEVRARGLSQVVRFLGRRSDMAALIGLAALVVLPSLAESFGFVLVEAMGLGKPVVATTTGGIPEVVADGETGLLVPPGDASALATAIARLVLQPEEAAALGEAGRSRPALFTFERMMRGYEAVYESILTRSGRPRQERGDPAAPDVRLAGAR